MAAREYGQYSGITRAMELVGERWALLIVRDLLVGPRRYGELAAGLPRIPSNILAARLKELQAAGILRRAPRSRVIVYELTPYGRELEPVVLALGAWGFKAMGDPREEQPARQRAARQRAAREREQRLEGALQELEQIRAAKREDKAQARASQSDPQARIMKQSDGGYAPGYNVQLSTEASHRIIVGAGVTQSGSDYGQLIGAVARVEQNLGRKPAQVVVDGGFTSRENIMAMAEQGVDMIGSLPEANPSSAGQQRQRGVSEKFYLDKFSYDAQQDIYRCPAGASLTPKGREFCPGVVLHKYVAKAEVCAACPFRSECCPGNQHHGRSVVRAVHSPEVRQFAEKMETEGAKAIYRQRGAVAEFPNAWLKDKLGLRQFRLRGLMKVRLEVLWAALTYNIQQWIRLSWRAALMPASN